MSEIAELHELYTPETGLCFQSKDRGTNWISISYEVGDEATEALIADLKAAGWGSQFRDAPPIQNIAETNLTKAGSGLFGGWTEEEKKQNMKEARAILRRHGYSGVPVQRLSWQDLI